MSYPFPAESLYRLILMKTYDDSFGGYNFSDHVDYAEDLLEESLPEETSSRLQGYTKRQSQIITMSIPEGRAGASLRELKAVLIRAEKYEDEYFIDQILTNYQDKLDEETYTAPDIDPDEFDDLLSKFSSF